MNTNHQNHILLMALVLFVAGASLAVYLLVPNAIQILSFSGTTFLQGELWRMGSFPFTHVSMTHLVENLIALTIAFLLAWELELVGTNAFLAFFGASLLVALADLVAFPAVILAGASVGIYALFGAVAATGSSFVSVRVMMLAFGIPITVRFLFQALVAHGWLSAALHFVGFLTGIGMTFLLRETMQRNRTRILEVESL